MAPNQEVMVSVTFSLARFGVSCPNGDVFFV